MEDRRPVKRHGIYGEHRPVAGEAVALLHVVAKGGLKLEKLLSRAVQRNEVHEIILVDEVLKPGDEVKGFAPVAFFEVGEGGLVVVGDPVSVNGVQLGTVAGFDLNHAPNHINVMVKTDSLRGHDVMLGHKIEIG
jgi:hypothetical protein